MISKHEILNIPKFKQEKYHKSLIDEHNLQKIDI